MAVRSNGFKGFEVKWRKGAEPETRSVGRMKQFAVLSKTGRMARAGRLFCLRIALICGTS
ncbi:MAG: hypothetical protein NZ934_01660 [Hadesarchaea archaeon]|nr:hypothetical protein [Hadesarchaea archaeon]